MKFGHGVSYTDPPSRYWEAKIGPVLFFISRRHSHIMWGEIPWGLMFGTPPEQRTYIC